MTGRGFAIVIVLVVHAVTAPRRLPAAGPAEVPVPQPLTVLTDDILPAPQGMIARWLAERRREACDRWEATYEALETPVEIAAYQRRLRARFVAELGGFPERTPMEPRITGTIRKPGYRVEQVLFESRPGFHVSGLCFVPESPRFQAPYPAVVVLCGHAADGKARASYQTGAALVAVHGMIGMIIDPICQGERLQHVDGTGEVPSPEATVAHSMIGLGSILLGQNTARFEIWDAMRAIDYLQSRADVQADRIGCMGNSGGGTQTAYLMALDDRVQAASPACFITGFRALLDTIGPQDAEQNIHGQLAWGMDHADYLLMRAPLPINLCVATHDFFPITGAWDAYRKAARLYARLGHPERLSLVEVDDTHGWHRPFRESAVQWMARWLAGRDEVVREPAIELLTEEEARVTPRGQVLFLPGARTAFDLNLEELEKHAEHRSANWRNPEAALATVRERAGIRGWDEIPVPAARRTATLERPGVTIETWVLEPEPGIMLPAILWRPAAASQDEGPPRFVICVNEAGKEAPFDLQGTAQRPEDLARAGATVLAVDLRGMGETAPHDGRWYDPRFGTSARHAVTAYLLGRSSIGMRAEDLLATLKWARTAAGFGESAAAEIVSVGDCSPAVLHAACIAPREAVAHVHLQDMLASWQTVVAAPVSEDQVVNVVHGALIDYDLPDLVGHLGSRVTVVRPLDALQRPVGPNR